MVASRFPILRGLDPLVARLQDNVSALLSPVAEALQATPIMGAPPPAWVFPTLLSGFANAGTGLAAASWQVDALGYLRGRGSIVHAAGVGVLTPIFQLPIEAFPGFDHLLSVFGGANPQAVFVQRNGLVSCFFNVIAGGGLTLDFSFQVGG